jgi:glutamine synthetase
MASGMAALSSLIEGGMSHRDAVAKMFKENRQVIFTGNGYSAEWPVEAAKRGLPNLKTTPLAVAKLNSAKAKKLFSDMSILSPDELDARAEVMFENYATTLGVEVQTLVDMIETGILPACAKDMAKYAAMPALGGERQVTYTGIKTETDKLKQLFEKKPHDLQAEATYLCDVVKPQMLEVRKLVDKAEGLLEVGLYPYPTYETLLYTHHS